MCEQIFAMLILAVAISVSGSWLYSASKAKTVGGVYADAFASFLFALVAVTAYTLIDERFLVPAAAGGIILFAAAWWASNLGGWSQ